LNLIWQDFDIIAIGFVDHNSICHFHNPRLMPCNSSPAPDILTTEKNQPYCEQLFLFGLRQQFL
jgi:hypothetical protein